MDIINQYSYIIASLFVMSGIFALSFSAVRRQATRKSWPLISSFVVSMALVLFGGFFVLHPGAATIDIISEVEQLLTNDRPTLLQFYSNYCIGCMSVKRAMDELAPEIGTTHDILRVDIHTDFGREIREELGFSYTPEFVLYDANGREIWRGHQLPPGDLLSGDHSAQINKNDA
jgi:thiol-disulfide isomerase/thioredoxin